MSDLDKLKDKYDKKDDKASSNVKNAKALTKELEAKRDSAPVRAVKQAVSGFRSQWSGIDDEGKVGIGKGTPGIYYNTVAIPAMAGVIDDKYAPEFAVEADKKAGRIREAVRKEMGIEAPKGALEHFSQAGGEMLAQLPIPGAWLNRVLSPVKSAGVAGKIATSPIEYLSPIVDPKKINYGVGTGFGGTIGTVGEMLEEPTSKALGGLIQKYETGGKVGQVKSFFSAIDKAIDTLKQKKGTGEQILKEIEKAPGVKKEELELRKIPQKLKDKKSITQEEVKALAAETPAPGIKTIVKSKQEVGVPEDWKPMINDEAKELLDSVGIQPVVNPEDRRMLAFMIEDTGDIVDQRTIRMMDSSDFAIDESKFRQIKDILAGIQSDFNRAVSYSETKSQPKFEKYTTPGGENYREILLQVDKTDAPLEGRIKALFGEDASLENVSAQDIINAGGGEDLAKDWRKYISGAYRSGHFDEDNIVVHVRTTDRTGPNGEKVLYVEEIQSDWHQAARKRRDEMIDAKLASEADSIRKQSLEIMESIGRSESTRENAAIREGIVNKLNKQRRAEIAKELPKDEGYAKSLSDLEGLSADDVLWEYGDRLDEAQKSWLRDYIERWELDVDGSPAGQAAQQQLAAEYEDWLKSNKFKGVPDAPWKSTSNELAVKQVLDLAAKEGYDTVAFSPGSEHVKRYGMNQYFDALTATKEPNGQIKLIGTKEGKTVVDKSVDADELGDYIGKEKAENILEQLKKPAPRNEAADELRGFVTQLQQKYDEDFPTFLRDKIDPEEKARWDDLLEQSRVWDRENMVQEGRNMVMPKNKAILTGQDLELTSAEGAGKKKIYDEIIPNFVRKYAKKEFGAEPTEIEISMGKKVDPNSNEDLLRTMDEIALEESDDYMNRAMERTYEMAEEGLREIGILPDTPEFEARWWDAIQEFEERGREEALRQMAEERLGNVEEKLRAFAVPVTPQMREKITSQGQPLFSVAAPVGLGAVQGIPEAEPSREPVTAPETEEMPVPFESGGQAKKEREDFYSIIEEDPIVRVVRDAAKQYVQGKEVESGVFGVSAGPVTVGRQMANIRDMGGDQYQNAQADFARLAQKYGNANLAATVMKPDQTRGVYLADLMASYPVGPGRAVAGVRGMKTPERSDVTGYNFGYSGKVGPGYLDAMVMKPRDTRQDTRYQVGYTLPFEEGGKVGKAKQVISIIGSKIKSGQPIEVEVFHGSPTAGIEKFKKSPSASSKGLADSEAGAFWATSDKQQAKEYSLGKTMENQFPSKKQAPEQGEIYNVLTSLKNPLVLWDDHYLPWDKNQAAHIDSPYTRKFALDYAKKNGHDGVIFANKSGKKREVSRFEIAVLPDEQGEYPGVIKKEIQNLPEEPQEFETGGRVGKAKEVIEAAMRKAGQKKGQVTDRNLTTLQDFHTSLGDAVRARAAEAQKQMDSWTYEYEPGQYVFTEHSAKKNLPPLKILAKSRTGWDIVREDPNNPLSKKVIDPETGRAKRTPWEPGYKVRREIGDDWAEFTIPASAIKGSVEPDEPYKRGGPVGFETGGKVGKTREAAEKLLRVLHGSPTRVTPSAERTLDVTTDPGYAVKRGSDKMLGQAGPPMVNKFDIPAGRLLRFEEQYSPEDVALMRRFFNKLPQGQAMTGEEIYDLAQGRDVILEGISKAGGFSGYERPNTGAVGKGQWFRMTDPEELKRAKKRGGLI